MDIVETSLDPSFNPDVTEYSATTLHRYEEATFIVEPAHEDGVVLINDEEVPHDEEYPVDLEMGSNLFTVEVTAQDQLTTMEYEVEVQRPFLGLCRGGKLYS